MFTNINQKPPTSGIVPFFRNNSEYRIRPGGTIDNRIAFPQANIPCLSTRRRPLLPRCQLVIGFPDGAPRLQFESQIRFYDWTIENDGVKRRVRPRKMACYSQFKRGNSISVGAFLLLMFFYCVLFFPLPPLPHTHTRPKPKRSIGCFWFQYSF